MHVRSLTLEECKTALSRASFGRLACARDNQPYVIPVYFAFDARSFGQGALYCFSLIGQKIKWMRINPLVCLEIDDVKNTSHWISVLVFGRYEEIPDTADQKKERQHAHHLLSKRALWWEPASAARDPSRKRVPSTPIYYRILVDHITGQQGFVE